MFSILNPKLIIKQGLNDKEVKHIEKLHEERERLFAKMENCDPKKKKGRIELRKLTDELESLEFIMQRGWKFKEDSNFHTWWFMVPHCLCPYIKNMSLFGKPARQISIVCPVHGDHPTKSVNIFEHIKSWF